MEINLTIVGGCFTVQNNIDPENLYHRILKKEFEEKCNDELKINIIRYEKFRNCVEKVSNYTKENPIDILIFHIRTEQFLRLSKVYYSYADEKDNHKWKLNLLLLNKIPPEEFEKLLNVMQPPSENSERQRRYRKIKISLNYLFGKIFGNRRIALKKYTKLVENIAGLCDEKKIKLILVGTASRPHLKIEDKISDCLSLYFESKAHQWNIPFVSLTGHRNDKNEPLFFGNGTHVNEAGHRRAAKFLLEKLNEALLI